MTEPKIQCPHPNNIWSLRGLADCIQVQLRTWDRTPHLPDARALQDELVSVTATLEKVQAISEVPVLASCACKRAGMQQPEAEGSHCC